MGWFGKKKIDPPAPRRDIIVADGAVLEQARGLLTAFEASQTTGGGDAQARAAIAAIARAGSLLDEPAWARSNQEFMVRMGQYLSEHGDTGTDRPWRWLSAVATSAERREDALLVARIAFFALFWLTALTPRLTVNDEMDMRLPKGIPDESRRELLAIALRVLPAMDPEALVVLDRPNPANTITVGTVLGLCHGAQRGALPA